MTQAQLARAVGTSERNIVRWENEKNAPRTTHVAAIAEATGREVSDLLSSSKDDAEEDSVARIRRIRAELVLTGRDDLADELRQLAVLAGAASN